MFQLSDRAFKKLLIALAIYLTSLFAANTLGLKIMPFIFGSHLSAAVFSFPIVFLMTDVVGEAYGKRAARFFFFRKKLGVKLFWLRSLLSKLWSQLLDSTIFMVIAFAGLYSTHTLINIIITWWLYKVAMGALYTPLSYLGIHLLRDKNEQTTSTT